MGVPSFYRWLCDRYPLIVKDAIEPYNEGGNDADTEGTNGGSPTVSDDKMHDNLYLDMNGIIHPCTHPSEGDTPQNEDQMFASIFQYIDRIMAIVRPRNLLYLAIDGVAPRAKMNQQRSRRFKTAREAKIAEECYQKLKEKFIEANKVYPEQTQRWDSNVITPGTPFMQRLSNALTYYVLHRQSCDPLWSNLQVILSDANIPGEGEHKIMQFIRSQRALANYKCNTRHVLYGADADLIMLGLATHEPHFSILREMVIPKRDLKCTLCEQEGHLASECPVVFEKTSNDYPTVETLLASHKKHWKPLQYLQLAVLREYLIADYPVEEKNRLKFPFDVERYIDDFVFICFFCGNDFLPHLPSLSIPSGSIDVLMLVYRKILPDLNDYLTKEGDIIVKTTSIFISQLAVLETPYFMNEYKRKEYMQRRAQREKALEANDEQQQRTADNAFNAIVEELCPEGIDHVTETAKESRVDKKRKLGEQEDDLMDKVICSDDALEQISIFNRILKRFIDKRNQIQDPVDTIKLGLGDQKQWKLLYYRLKFHLEAADDIKDFSKNVSSAYFQGLCWVLQYYYQGCASWEWFYPFHYAPFASDLIQCNFKVKFTPGRPFNPFEQLLAVLPPQSSHCLPSAYAEVMISPTSPIRDFFPSNFYEDPDGKKFRWQWVALLPFVDQFRLVETALLYVATLTEDERYRNRVGHDVLYFPATCHNFASNAEMQQALVEGGDKVIQLNETMGLGGYIRFDKKYSSFEKTITSSIAGQKSFFSRMISCVFIGAPKVRHQSKLLPNVRLPTQKLSKFDIEDPIRKKKSKLHLRERFVDENIKSSCEQTAFSNSFPPRPSQPGYRPAHLAYESSSLQSNRHNNSYQNPSQLHYGVGTPNLQAPRERLRPPMIWKIARPMPRNQLPERQHVYQ